MLKALGSLFVLNTVLKCLKNIFIKFYKKLLTKEKYSL